jgi:hypothetical protein
MHPYVPHLIYSVALTSVSTHLLLQRKSIAEQRASISAQISILESIVQRLRSNEDMSDSELAQLKKLARVGSHRGAHPSDGASGDSGGRIGWKAALSTPKTSQTLSDRERKEIEEGAASFASTYPRTLTSSLFSFQFVRKWSRDIRNNHFMLIASTSRLMYHRHRIPTLFQCTPAN